MVCISHLEPSMVGVPEGTQTLFSQLNSIPPVRWEHWNWWGTGHRLFSSQPHPSRRTWCFRNCFSFPLQVKMLLSLANVLKSCLRGKTGGESILACSQIEFLQRQRKVVSGSLRGRRGGSPLLMLLDRCSWISRWFMTFHSCIFWLSASDHPAAG